MKKPAQKNLRGETWTRGKTRIKPTASYGENNPPDQKYLVTTRWF